MSKRAVTDRERCREEGVRHLPYYTRIGAARGFCVASVGETSGWQLRDNAFVRTLSHVLPACLRCVLGGVERPQGGRGIDHRAKVQQNKAQTGTPLFSSHFLSSYLMSGVFLCGSLTTHADVVTPGAIGTLFMDVEPLIF